MRRWAALTAVLTIPYGISFLVHERPPTGGHALAGLLILGAGIGLLACIAALGVQRTRGNAISLLVFQIVATAAAVSALLLQQLPFTAATFLALVAFTVPVVGGIRHFTPAAWTPKPVTHRNLVVDIVVEGLLVAGALALMIGLRAVSIGLIVFVVQGIGAIVFFAWQLRIRHGLAGLEDQLRSAAETDSTGRDRSLAG